MGFCFSQLGLNKVYLDVWEENQRAIKCYLKCGFKEEGVLREHVRKDGRYHNKVIMSVLRQEWEGLNR
jgi:RimJ/RimL family protein N-acetyltransferase